MLIITSDNFRCGGRNIAWDICPNPLQQFSILPLDFHRISGRIFDEHGEYDCDLDVVAKVNSNSVFIPMSSALAIKIFRNKDGQDVEDLFRAQKLAAEHELAPVPYQNVLVKHKNTQYWGIVQERLRRTPDFKAEAKEIFDVDTTTGEPPKHWGDDAALLWHFIKYAGPHQDKVKNRTVRYITAMRKQLKEAGLETDFHVGDADEGDVSAHNLLWSRKQLFFVDFDFWQVK